MVVSCYRHLVIAIPGLSLPSFVVPNAQCSSSSHLKVFKMLVYRMRLDKGGKAKEVKWATLMVRVRTSQGSGEQVGATKYYD